MLIALKVVNYSCLIDKYILCQNTRNSVKDCDMFTSVIFSSFTHNYKFIEL